MDRPSQGGDVQGVRANGGFPLEIGVIPALPFDGCAELLTKLANFIEGIRDPFKPFRSFGDRFYGFGGFPVDLLKVFFR